MPNVFMKLEGGEELRRKLRKLGTAVVEEMAKELPEQAKNLMSRANIYAPVEQGELKGSSKVSTHVNGKKTLVRVAAAYLSEYAAAVHEGVFGGRKAKNRPSSYKWYERAFNEFEPTFYERIAAKLRSMVNRGT